MIGGTTTKLGVVLVVAGALLMAGPIFGFSTLAADRGVNVGTAATDSALLAIEETGETPSQKSDAEVIKITNNGGATFELDAEATIVDDPNGALALTENGFASTLSPGDSTGLELTCDGGGNGQATLEVSANATSQELSISDVSYSHTFEYWCTGNGGIGPSAFDVSDLQMGQSTQNVTFDGDALGNKDSVTIDLSALQDAGIVDYSGVGDADTTVINGSSHDVGFDASTGELTFVKQGGNSVGTIKIRLSNVQPLESGSATVTYSDDQSRTDSDEVAVTGVIIQDGETVDSIDATGPVTAGSDVTIDGDVTTDDVFETGAGAEVKGDIDAAEIMTGDDSTLKGSVDADESATIGTDTDVKADVTAGGSLSIGAATVVDGGLDAGDHITTGGDVTVKDAVDADGDLTTGDDIFKGTVTVDGDLNAGDGATFEDDVTVAGTAYVGCDVTFKASEPADTVDDC